MSQLDSFKQATGFAGRIGLGWRFRPAESAVIAAIIIIIFTVIITVTTAKR